MSKYLFILVLLALGMVVAACTTEVEVVKEVEVTRVVEVPAAAEGMEAAAPLPAIAKGPAISQDKGYLVEEIKDGVYWVTDGSYQAMFLTTGEVVIAVDAPPSIGENYVKAIAEVTDEPVTHVT